MSVLIVAMPKDKQVHAVHWALKCLGGDCDVLYPLDLSNGAAWTWRSGDGRLLIEFNQTRSDIAFDNYSSIWMRRPPAIIAQEHLIDPVERSVAEAELGILVRSSYEALERNKFSVNRYERTRISAYKPYQFEVALRAGLVMPTTIVSNSKSQILDFFENQPGDIVYKPLKPGLWRIDSGPSVKGIMVPTTIITREMLTLVDFAASPGIFQQCIDKVSEIRATVMGRTIFSWEKSFDRDDLDVDWRFMHRGAKLSLHNLPDKVAIACFNVLDELGLVFGCFDFIVDRQGQYYFLEVNPQGQWLWADGCGLGINQLEAMAQFLLSGDPEFKYRPENKVSMSRFKSVDDGEFAEIEANAHVGNWSAHQYHQHSFRALDIFLPPESLQDRK
jgi:hypothetical protein